MRNIFINTRAESVGASLLETATIITRNTSLPDIVAGDRNQYAIKFVVEEGLEASWMGDGSVVQFSVGLFDAPSGGTFDLSYSADGVGNWEASPNIPHNVTAAALETRLNELPSIVAVGGLEVIGEPGGPFIFAFRSATQVGMFNANSVNLTPYSGIHIAHAEGDPDSPARFILQMRRALAAFTDEWTYNAESLVYEGLMDFNSLNFKAAIGAAPLSQLTAEISVVHADGTVRTYYQGPVVVKNELSTAAAFGSLNLPELMTIQVADSRYAKISDFNSITARIVDLETASATYAARLDSVDDEIASLSADVQLSAGLVLTKEDRDGFNMNGGVMAIPGAKSNLGMAAYAPLSFLMTVSDFKSWGASTHPTRLVFGNYSYNTTGFYLVYRPSDGKLIFVYYSAAGGQSYFAVELLGFDISNNANTLAVIIGDDVVAGELSLKIRNNGRDLAQTVTGRRLEAVAFSTNNPIRFGGALSTGGYTGNATDGGMDAKISRFAIFNRVLTDDEIALYEAGGMPAGAVMQLEDTAGNQWRDVSGNGNHATLDGSGTIEKGTATASKNRDTFINSEVPAWTASGTKYLISDSRKILPDNCQFSPILLADKNCTMAIKDSTGAVYASVPLTAGVPVNAGTFFNLTDGRIALTPSALVGGYPLTVNVNLEVRKF